VACLFEASREMRNSELPSASVESMVAVLTSPDRQGKSCSHRRYAARWMPFTLVIMLASITSVNGTIDRKRLLHNEYLITESPLLCNQVKGLVVHSCTAS
jgi:hypothetical protein